MSSAIAVQNLSLAYDREEILHDVHFDVEKGEFFIIIGANGTGKTTLLKTLAGIMTGFQGRISVLGRNLQSYGRRQLSQHIAVVPQQAPEDFPFSVAETVLMGRSPHLGLVKLEKQEDYDIARQAMAFTDVTRFAGRRLDQLSGGERQRVIIARAICQQPQIILLDEPTASLDPAHQIRIMDLMDRLRRERGTTVVMVSHELNMAAMYGSRLLLLDNGRVNAVGLPGEVLTTKNLEASYGCRMAVDENPFRNVPRVMPVPEKFRQNM